ncbi:hypothetical protein SpCBS45565_g06850 [Spizellomyces sp. 'palustris']|nr:hypothetical protein SpCBS45565_g06850 [Spizellomyces sp. 'palustris']
MTQHFISKAQLIKSLVLPISAEGDQKLELSPLVRFFSQADVNIESDWPILKLAKKFVNLRSLYISAEKFLCTDVGDFLHLFKNLTHIHLEAHPVHIFACVGHWLSRPRVSTRLQSIRIHHVTLEDDFRIEWDTVFATSPQPHYSNLKEWSMVCVPYDDQDCVSACVVEDGIKYIPTIAVFLQWMARGIQPGQLEVFNVHWRHCYVCCTHVADATDDMDDAMALSVALVEEALEPFYVAHGAHLPSNPVSGWEEDLPGSAEGFCTGCEGSISGWHGSDLTFSELYEEESTSSWE